MLEKGMNILEQDAQKRKNYLNLIKQKRRRDVLNHFMEKKRNV